MPSSTAQLLRSHSIKGNQELNIKVDIDYKEEMILFKKFTDEKKLDELFARYPIRKSNVFNEIAKALKFSNKQDYEQTVVVQITKNDKLSQKLKSRTPSFGSSKNFLYKF